METYNSFLIDTHIFIWWMEGNPALSQEVYQLITNPQNHIFLSVASIWEIIIKKSRKKLKIPIELEESLTFSNFTPLAIQLSHILALEQLPLYHHDPFDRILIAQAKTENFILVTEDEKIKKYEIQII